MTREELIAQKELEKEFKKSTTLGVVSATEIVDSSRNEITEEEKREMTDALKSRKLSYFQVGDHVILESNKLKHSFVNGTSFRVSDVISNKFVSIGNSSALYLHGVKVSEIRISKNKIKHYLRRAYIFLKNLFINP